MNFLSGELVKNTIRTCKNIIKLFTTVFLIVNLWITNYYVGISSELVLFGFQISKGSAYGQSTWKYSVRTNQRVIHCIFISWGLCNSDLLEAWLTVLVYHTVGLINMSASRFNPMKLTSLTRFMIITKIQSNLSMIFRPNGSTITNVDYENIIIKSHYQISATSRLAIHHLLSCLKFCKTFVHIVVISYFASFENSLLNIMGEFRLQNYVVVEMFFEIFGTLVSTMTVINCKYLYLWPLVFWDLTFFAFWLNNV